MVIQPIKKGRYPLNDKRAKRLYRRFNQSRFTRRAEKLANNREFLQKLRRSAIRLSAIVKKAKDKVKRILDYIFGKESDWGTRIQAIAALIYFIAPLDFVPDIIPGVGYLEDIAIMGMVLGMITSRVIRKEKEINIGEITQSVKDYSRQRNLRNKGQTKKVSSVPIFSSLFRKAKKDIEESVEKNFNKQIRVRLIIIIISLSGAVIAAVITLLLKYHFRAF